MTKNQAIRKAIHNAKRTDSCRYVVYESGEYDTATECDMDSFYLGAQVVAYVECDGEVSEGCAA